MASNMEYEANTPLSYEVEEGELSSGSGRSSPGTIRDNAHRNAVRKHMNITKQSPP